MLIYLQMLESPEEKSILEQIYLEYRGLMYHVAYEILHNEQDAEDAVHHAFVNLSANKNYYIRIVNTTGWGGPFTDLWLGGTVSISQ